MGGGERQGLAVGGNPPGLYRGWLGWQRSLSTPGQARWIAAEVRNSQFLDRIYRMGSGERQRMAVGGNPPGLSRGWLGWQRSLSTPGQARWIAAEVRNSQFLDRIYRIFRMGSGERQRMAVGNPPGLYRGWLGWQRSLSTPGQARWIAAEVGEIRRQVPLTPPPMVHPV